MNLLSKVIKYGLLIFFLSFVIWFWVTPYFILIKGPFTVDEIDLNGSGLISPSEAQYHFDHGTRKYVKDGRICTEYYALKDGIELKTNCEKEE